VPAADDDRVVDVRHGRSSFGQTSGGIISRV